MRTRSHEDNDDEICLWSVMMGKGLSQKMLPAASYMPVDVKATTLAAESQGAL